MPNEIELPPMLEVESLEHLGLGFNDETWCPSGGTWKRYSSDNEDTIIFTGDDDVVCYLIRILHTPASSEVVVYTPEL